MGTTPQRISREFRDAWVATLLHGGYTWGRGYFRKQDNCCCAIGVALDMVDPKGWGPIKRQSDSAFYCWRDRSGTPDPGMCEALGLSIQDLGVIMCHSDESQSDSYREAALHISKLPVHEDGVEFSL